MKQLLILVIGIFLISCLNAQTGSLYENASAIVKERNAVFSQTDLNNATYKVTEVITILNKQGEGFGYFRDFGDKFRELKDFSGVIKNAAGAVVKKVGKKDLIISSLSEKSFKTDNYDIQYGSKHPTYPYTVEYTYEFKLKDGIIHYPSFMPAEGYRQSVENAHYTIEVPADIKLRYHSNFDCDIKERTENNKRIYSFSATNLKAIDREPYAPVLGVLPKVNIAPTDFCYDSKCGNMSDWNSYGKWVSALLEGRDVLPLDFTNSLKELVKDAKTDKEKVEILYKYLQDNFRYVSIQLGIGGFQPIEAQSTLKSRFGDCKGLTYFMKSMLRAVDIESNYCEIYSGNQKDFYRDFSSVTQTNHAILLVPLQSDSIWLECTSSTFPPGYVHDGIAGHDALVVTDEGGKICKLPTYTSEQNKKESKLQIEVLEDGSAKGSAIFVEHLFGYENEYRYIVSNDREKKVEYIHANIRMPKIEIGEINTSENRSEFPSSSLTLAYEALNYANKTGTRLFIPVCPLKKSYYNVFSAAKREFDIERNYGFSESDTIVIQIPEMYSPESLPKDISLTTDFGTFSTQSVLEGNKITYIQNTDIFSGRYSKERYKEIKDFFSEIAAAIKRKVVIKKS